MGRKMDPTYEMENKNGPRATAPRKDDYQQFFSPLEKHGCTDIICTVIMFLFVALLVALSIIAYSNGNPSQLILPHDSTGRICGNSKGLEDKKYLFFFDLVKCLSVSAAVTGCPTIQICVESCPDLNAYDKIPQHYQIIREKFCDPFNNTICPSYLVKSKPLFGRCVPEIIADITENSLDVITAYDPDTNNNVTIEVPSVNGMSDLTVGKLKDAVKYLGQLINLKESYQLAYEDFTKSWPLILAALGVAALLSFIWMFVLRFIIKPMVYISILAVFGVLGFGIYFCIQEYFDIKNNNPGGDDFSFQFEQIYDIDYLKSLKETWLAFGIILGVIFLILLLIIFFLRKRITLACDLIKETSKAITSLPMSLIWPIIPFALQLGVICYCVSIAIYLASSGKQLFKVTGTNYTDETTTEPPLVTPVPSSINIGDYCIPDDFYKLKETHPELKNMECYFYKFGYDTKLPVDLDSELVAKYYSSMMEFINKYQWIPQAYVIFMFLWLTAFMSGLNSMTLAGSFGAWYWTRFKNISKEYENKLPLFTLFGSFGRAIFFHFGTIAFGSLLIAIVKFIRLVLEFFMNRVKSKTDSSKIAKFLLCCCKCCFMCLEKFLKFLNRYAFIITAVYSLNFCRAAGKAFKLITTNVLRIVVVDKISGFVLLLSNLAITAGIGVLSFYFFSNKIPIDGISKYSPDLNYYILPVIVIVIGTFVVTKVFFDVFSMGIDSILICVLIDLDENDGSKGKPYFMSKNLRRILKINNKRD